MNLLKNSFSANVFLIVFAFFLSASLLITSCQQPLLDQQQIDMLLVQRSTYIFSGTVQKLGAAHMASVPVNDNTAVVKVEHVYTPTDILGDLTNKEVTIQLKEDKTIGPGEQAIFFTNGWIYGDGVALTEVGRLKVEDPEKFKKEIAELLKQKEDQKLTERLNRASVVVVAKVKGTRVLKVKRRLPITEHSPDWWEATMQIISVEKGDVRGQDLVMLFPSSKDEVWIDSPRPQSGQEGVWILQKDQQEKGPLKHRLPGYTALDPLDFQPVDQLEKVRRLLSKK
jgi:hypothetical protein